MNTIRQYVLIMLGTIAGIAMGVSLMVMFPATAQQAPKQHDIVGDGYTVDCNGNGRGGFRRCDIKVDKHTNIRRFDMNFYQNNRFEIGIVNWVANSPNGGGNGNSGVSVDQFTSRVVRP